MVVKKDTTPTHFIKMKSKHSDSTKWHRIGAGWLNDAGDVISLKLDKGVIIDWHDEDAWLIAVVVNDIKRKTSRKKAA